MNEQGIQQLGQAMLAERDRLAHELVGIVRAYLSALDAPKAWLRGYIFNMRENIAALYRLLAAEAE